MCIGASEGASGSAARLVATSAPRLGQPRGRVTYERYVMGNCAGIVARLETQYPKATIFLLNSVGLSPAGFFALG